MSKKVLILTSSPGFGELMCQALVAAGDYACTLAMDDKHAISSIRRSIYDLLILDGDLGEKIVSKISEISRQENKDGRVLLVPAEESKLNEALAKVDMDRILPNPFYLPDLQDAVIEFFGESLPIIEKQSGEVGDFPPRLPVKQKKEEAPEWLQDVSLAAQYLARLSLESSSQAAMITLGHRVWAYAGELPQAASEELARAIAKQWDQISDLAQFVHLESTDADYMLYATSLGGDYALAMVFDTQIPFSKMREQANHLAQSLARRPEEVRVEGLAAQENFSVNQGGADDSPGKIEKSNVGLEKAGFSSQYPEINDGENIEDEVDESSVEREIFEDDGLRLNFVLIPRLPHHQLEGDLQKQLSIWLPQLCVAFDWRLEQFRIASRYLQWTVFVGAEVSADRVVETMKTQLSERIFHDFALLKRENPSGEFWAAGALVVAGEQASRARIENYIKEIRRRQGITGSL